MAEELTLQELICGINELIKLIEELEFNVPSIAIITPYDAANVEQLVLQAQTEYDGYYNDIASYLNNLNEGYITSTLSKEKYNVTCCEQVTFRESYELPYFYTYVDEGQVKALLGTNAVSYKTYTYLSLISSSVFLGYKEPGNFYDLTGYTLPVFLQYFGSDNSLVLGTGGYENKLLNSGTISQRAGWFGLIYNGKCTEYEWLYSETTYTFNSEYPIRLARILKS